MIDDEDPAQRLMHLMDGYLTTQLLYIAAVLRIDEVLATGAATGVEIAEAVGADADVLPRVLRGLVAEGVLDQDEQGRFSLTDLGAALDGLRGAALVRGDLYFQSASSMLDAVRHGDVAFDRTYGKPFFDHLVGHPEHAAAFEASMAGRSAQEARDVVAAYDFADLRTVVDVGGGRGILLATVLRQHPNLRGVLIDQPSVADAARRHFADAGLSERADYVAGDFFIEVPPGGDAYLLSRVLHDWSDADAVRILRACRRAIPAHGRLLIIDALLPGRAADRPAAVRMDLHMLLLFGSRERTESEFESLLTEAGFTLRRVIATTSPAGLGILEAQPV